VRLNRIPLLEHDVLTNDYPVFRRFLQGGKDTIHVFNGIDENDDWQLATSLYQMRSLDALSS
jgi:hypothetical protein